MTYLFIDLETTGVNIKTDKPVQIGMTLSEDLISDRILMNTLVHPCQPIDPKATEVNHITDAMVIRAPDYAVAVWQAYLVAQAVNPSMIVTFNGSQFDLPILEIITGAPFLPGTPRLDVLDLVYRVFPYSERFNLGSQFYQMFGVQMPGAHDALADLKGTMQLLQATCEKTGKTPKQFSVELETPKPYEIFPISKKYKGKPLAEVSQSFANWLRRENEKNGTSMRPDLQASVEWILQYGEIA